jgi:predicted DCC family thiol-disulfide oxidoreductase YuxK
MIILFDGSCDFCTRWAHRLKSCDKNDVLIFEDITDPGLVIEFYRLSSEEVAQDIHAVEMDEDLEVTKVYKGIDVLLGAFEKMGYFWPKLARLPLIYQLWKLAYYAVKKIRKYL